MDNKSNSTINYDSFGFPYNREFPPANFSGKDEFHGYTDPYRETLFYDFAVQGYDLRFAYKGKWYYCLTGDGYVALCDDNFNIEYQKFSSANEFLKTFEIDGQPLIKLIDSLDDVQPM